jgi:putative ABC transport system permease protein
LEIAMGDIRLGVRLLLKQPTFSFVAILTLGLGIGASTAIFSVIDAALLRPLPYPDPDRLVGMSVEKRAPDGSAYRVDPSAEDMRDWQGDGRVFSHIARVTRFSPPVVLDGPAPERVDVRYISEGYLGVYGVTPLLGRGFGSDDMREGAPHVVLLGHGFWQSRFGGDRAVVGRTIRIDNGLATIVGVLPAAFHRDLKIWLPLQTRADSITRREIGTPVQGRLQPGISIDQAERRLAHLTLNLERNRGRRDATGIRVRSLYDDTTADYRTTTNILTAAVALVLLIACVNVAGLLLARGAARQPELAVRASIGAGRRRLARQLLTENLVLAVAGGAAGVAIAWLSLDMLVANIPMSLPANAPVGLNPQVFAFATVLSLVTGVVFGLVPAIRLSGVNVTATLSHAGRRHGSGLSRRGGQLLIAVEVALAVVLLAGAGLMIRSFARVLAVDVGFDPESIVTMEVVPVDPNEAVMREYYPVLLQSLRALPDVEAVGAVDYLPLKGMSNMSVALVDGEKWGEGGRTSNVHVRHVMPGYFEAIGFRLKQGRFPAEIDRGAAIGTAVLNEQGVRQLLPSGSPLGRRLELLGGVSLQVIGVVADVRHIGPLAPVFPEIYVYGRAAASPMTVVVRPRGRIPGFAEQLQRAARATGTRVVVQRIRPGTDWYDDTIVTPRRRTVLLGLLGGLGLLLALVGVFGMTAYAVARRTHEIGVRMALGARPADVVAAMMRDSTWPAGVGILFGLGAATMATRVIASFLFNTTPTDTMTFTAVGVALAVAACLAAWIPARRAAHVDPVAALRSE